MHAMITSRTGIRMAMPHDVQTKQTAGFDNDSELSGVESLVAVGSRETLPANAGLNEPHRAWR
jgi:hypothetical protein